MRNTFIDAPIRKVAKLALIALAVVVLVPTFAIADTSPVWYTPTQQSSFQGSQ